MTSSNACAKEGKALDDGVKGPRNQWIHLLCNDNKRIHPLIILLLFFFLAAVLTYPLCFMINGRYIPSFHHSYLIDPLLNVYILGWNIHKILSLNLHHYFDANIFYPYRYTLAYSENLITTALLFALPVYLITKNIIIAYNITMFAGFVLSGWFMYILTEHLTKKTVPAVLAGILFSFSSFRFAYLGNIQMITAMWIPLTILYIHKYFETHKYSYIAFASLFFVLNAGACAYYMIFLSIWVFCMFFFFGLAEVRAIKKTMMGFLIFVFLSSLGTFPIYYPYLKLQGLMELQRSLLSVNSYAAPINILSGGIIIPLSLMMNFVKKNGMGWGTENKKNLLFYTIMAYLFILLSIGPYLLLKNNLFNPIYILLYKYMPGFNVIRNPGKFWTMIYLAGGMLFAYALTLKNKPLSILIIIIIIMRSINMPIHMTSLPDNGKVPAVYAWLKKQKGEFAITEMPLTVLTNHDDCAAAWSSLYSQGDYTVVFKQPLSLSFLFYGLKEHEREYYSLYHFKKLFNGYSGYWSNLYLASLRFTPTEQLALFKAIDIKYIIVHKDEFQDQQTLANLVYLLNTSDVALFKKVYDSQNTLVYEILDRNEAFDPDKTYLKDYAFQIFFKREHTQSGSVAIMPYIENRGDRPAVFLYENHLTLETLSVDNKVIQKTKLDYIPFSAPFLLPGDSAPFVFTVASSQSVLFTPNVYKIRFIQDGTIIWESLRNKLVVE